MKALTLWQPWAWAIADGKKRVENRTWPPPASVRDVPIAIHAGKRLDRHAAEHLRAELPGLPGGMDVPDEFVSGAIVALATVAAYVDERGGTVRTFGPADTEKVLRHYYYQGPVGWVLRDVVALDEPVSCRGAQGLWSVPPVVQMKVLAQMGGGGTNVPGFAPPPCRCGCDGPSTHRVTISGCGREDGVEYACAVAARYMRGVAGEFGGSATVEPRPPGAGERRQA